MPNSYITLICPIYESWFFMKTWIGAKKYYARFSTLGNTVLFNGDVDIYCCRRLIMQLEWKIDDCTRTIHQGPMLQTLPISFRKIRDWTTIHYYIKRKGLARFIASLSDTFNIMISLYRTTNISTVYFSWLFRKVSTMETTFIWLVAHHQVRVSSLPQPVQAMLLTLLLSSSLIFSVKLKKYQFQTNFQ